MAQDKEVQNMLTQELFDRMDRISNRTAGYNEGKEQGRKEGYELGEKRIISLMSRLFLLGRVKDAEKASNDVAFREKLYKEFELEEV